MSSCRYIVVTMVAVAAIAAGCGGSSQPADPLASAFSSASNDVNQLTCSTALTDLYGLQVKFIQGGHRAATVARAHIVLRLADQEAHDQHCTAGERRKIASAASLIRCDITASREGRYCNS